MFEINASGNSISPSLARQITYQAMLAMGMENPEFNVRMSLAQAYAWEKISIPVQCVKTSGAKPDAIPERTFAGFPLSITDDFPKDCIEFLDAEGNTVGKIVNLAIPDGE
jgi:hypothetical protein